MPLWLKRYLGGFSDDPLFLDEAAGDLRLLGCSPGVNAGDNAFVPSGLTHDLSGSDRVQDAVVDIGAYEQPAFALRLDAVSPISCRGARDGGVTFTTTGAAPVALAWTNEQGTTGASTTGLPPGRYLFTATDANGCTDTLSVTLDEPEAIRAAFAVTPAAGALDATGAIHLREISGGRPPYAYAWSTGARTASLAGLRPGHYAVTITDAGGCQYVAAFTVEFTNAAGEAPGAAPLVVYPNPARAGQVVQLQLPAAAEQSRIRLLDAVGRTVAEFHRGDQLVLPADLAPGLYLLLAQSGDSRVYRARLVVR